MSLTPEQAVDAILKVHRDAWLLAGYTDAQVTYTDIPCEVPAGVGPSEQVWCRVTVRHATGRQSSLTGGLGTQRFTNRGTLWVQVFGPMGDGSTAGRGAAQTVAGAFRDAKIAVLFRNVSPPIEKGADGAFERFDVKADFEYDEVR